MEDISKIEKTVARIESKLDEITVSLNELVTAWPYLCKRIDRVEKHLYGNGSAGILVKVNALIYGIVAISSAVGLLISGLIAKWLGV